MVKEPWVILTNNDDDCIGGKKVPLDGYLGPLVKSKLCNRTIQALSGNIGEIERSIVSTSTRLYLVLWHYRKMTSQINECDPRQESCLNYYQFENHPESESNMSHNLRKVSHVEGDYYQVHEKL